MVTYLQASDLHGVNRVKAVIDAANRRDDLDAVFLLGDLVDVEYAHMDYEYGRVYQELMQEVQERDAALGEIIRSRLPEHSEDDFNIMNQVRINGGIDRVRQLSGMVPEREQRTIDRWLDAYDADGARLDQLARQFDEVLQSPDASEEVRAVQLLESQVPRKLAEQITALQTRASAELDDIFGSTPHPVYVGDGNHDGQALRNLDNAINMGVINEVIEINGVRFAYEANTREAIAGGREVPGFYEGLDSIDPSRDLKTTDLRRVVSNFREGHGENADVDEFVRDYLADNPVYNRLDAMGDIDVLFCHNPVGQQNATSRGQRQSFYDYSFAVGEIMKKKKPSIHGFGHMHGDKGWYNRADPTFGYEFEALHSTNNRFYVVDVDDGSKKINWIDIYEVVDPENN